MSTPNSAVSHLKTSSAKNDAYADLFAYGSEVVQELRDRGLNDHAAHLIRALGGDARQVMDTAKAIRNALIPTTVIHRQMDRFFYRAWAAWLAFDESSPLGE